MYVAGNEAPLRVDFSVSAGSDLWYVGIGLCAPFFRKHLCKVCAVDRFETWGSIRLF